MSLQFNCTFRRSMHGLQYLIQILVRLVVKKLKILCKVFPIDSYNFTWVRHKIKPCNQHRNTYLLLGYLGKNLKKLLGFTS